MRPKKFLLAVFIVLAATCVCAAKDSSPVFRVSVMQSDEHLFHESIIENLEGALEKTLGAKTKVEISTDSPETIKTKLKDNTGKSSELVKEVVQGKADAALLPACFLEQHVVEYPSLYREIKVLNPLRSSELPCTVSTTLYPNWSVLITPNISMKQATDIAATLLTQPKSSDGAWWSVSTQFDGVDKLLKNLKVEQYSYLREWTLRRFFEEYFPFIILFLSLIHI